MSAVDHARFGRNPELHHAARERSRFPELPQLAVFGSPDDPFIELPPLRRSCPSAQQRDTAAGASPPLSQDPPGEVSAAALPSGAMASVAARRLDQLAKGYTVERDTHLPIGFLLNEGRRYLQDAFDWLSRPNKDPQRSHYRNKLVNLAALVLAEIDRLDAREGSDG